jgi:hypothetical protein
VITKITLLAGILATCAAAQPPNIIRVIRNGSIQLYFEARAAVNVIGMSSISGLSETWLIELHDTFGSLEDLDRALSASDGARIGQRAPTLPEEILTPVKSLIAVYRAALSYRPEQAFQNLPKMRYFDVVTYRIRPDTESDFARLLKARRFALDSVNIDRPDVVYQIVSGEPIGTYIVLTPLPSLRILDDGRPPTPVYAEGDQAVAKKAAADTELVREHLWFRVEPRVSYVSDEFASADTAFWHPAAK